MKKVPLYLLFLLGSSYAEEAAESKPPAKSYLTIADKKASLTQGESSLDKEMHNHLLSVNEALAEERAFLQACYEKAQELYQEHADMDEYTAVLEEIKNGKGRIEKIHNLWRKEVASLHPGESYALLHEPETLLSHLIIDYGSSENVYLIPAEIGSIRLSINSNLPIPRESWEECLELILSQYGIGIRQLNSYLRELYFIRDDLTGLKAITDSLIELGSLPPKERICYVMNEEYTDARKAHAFFRKFANETTTRVEIFGGRLFIIATVDTIQELFKLYGFIKDKTSGQELQLVSLSKINPKEMQSILDLAFAENDEVSPSLRIVSLSTLTNSLVLSGTKEDVQRACRLIEDIESRIEDPKEKTLYWYTAKHSDAEELADILAKVYDLLINTPVGAMGEKVDAQIAKVKEDQAKTTTTANDKQIVSPEKIEPNSSAPKKTLKTADGKNNFIVDRKTSAIMMVVEQEALPKIKQLLKKLDVPKKMVQIEVLLFEKKMENHSKCGLNLLRLGSAALNIDATGFGWAGGILDFFISRSKKDSGIPAYDIAYNFLLGQDDVQINASPSVTTMNQTPAKIAIVEEISINAGADDKQNKIFKRAEYGIILNITPTINVEDDSEEGLTGERFITLDTEITFDTTKKNSNERPEVTRRHIKNYVRIADGQTVILGGLRRKNQEDKKDSIPFLGDIPGIGKLFSSTDLSDNTTEMFIFITPKIIADPIEDAERLKHEMLAKRAGDLPEYLRELDIAKDKQRKRLFSDSLTAILGRDYQQDAPRESRNEYDGKS